MECRGIVGGAGLIGGALLEDAWQDHDDHEREEGYQDGWCLPRIVIADGS